MLQRLRRHAALETAVLLALAIALALTLQAYAIKPYKIPSASMEPTLRTGDRVLVDRFSHRVLNGDVHVGDVVVFNPPAGADSEPSRCGAADEGADTPTPCDRPTRARSAQTFIKRVVGVGGDHLLIRDGRVLRNGRRERDPYARACAGGPAQCDFPRPITVPRGFVFLMGDNRGDSDDSRFWGPVPEAWIVGKAFAVYWPPAHLGGA
jgi:signal peptidase I